VVPNWRIESREDKPSVFNQFKQADDVLKHADRALAGSFSAATVVFGQRFAGQY
jgi:hypothetical protein